MKVITEGYKEISSILIAEVPEVKWIDMWHNQINFLEDEYAFPFPAVFLSFRADTLEDTTKGDQDITMYVDVYLAYETLADTYQGAVNQESALEFSEILQKIHFSLQTRSSSKFGTLSRASFAPIDTGTGIMLYRVTYSGIISDYSVSEMRGEGYTEIDNPGYRAEKGEKPSSLLDGGFDTDY